MYSQLTLTEHLNPMYKVKKQGDTIAVSGIAQSFSGLVEDDLYKLIIKADPKLKDKFEKVEEKPEVKEEKESAPLSDNA